MRIMICDKTARDAESCRSIIEKTDAFDGEDLVIEVVDSCERMLVELSDDPNDADVIITETEFGGKMGGIDAVRKLRSIGYSGEVIFLTNDRSQVFDSFEVRPANYLLKDSLSVKKYVEVVTQAAKYARKRKRDMLSFACAGEIKNIALEDIRYFEVVQKIVEVHYNDEVFEFYSTMKKLENQLFGKGFVRTHRSFLVNKDHISYVMGSELVLDNDEIVPLHQKYAKSLAPEKKTEKVTEGSAEDPEESAENRQVNSERTEESADAAADIKAATADRTDVTIETGIAGSAVDVSGGISGPGTVDVSGGISGPGTVDVSGAITREEVK